jgi:hypothetical protein
MVRLSAVVRTFMSSRVVVRVLTEPLVENR